MMDRLICKLIALTATLKVYIFKFSIFKQFYNRFEANRWIEKNKEELVPGKNEPAKGTESPKGNCKNLQNY